MTSGVRIVAWDPADSAALRGCEAAWGAALDIVELAVADVLA
jgi:hypothetical protein